MTAAVVANRVPGLRSLILVDPTFLSLERQREVHESDVAEQHRRLLDQEESEVVADLLARHPGRSAEIVGLLAGARRRTHVRAFDVLTPPNPDHRRLVGAIRVPTLLVIGDSPVVSLETAMELQGLNPRVHVEQIADAGHGLPYDQPELLAAVVGAFLRSLAGP
jgi:pimeloyl-ACP methyl ester carboxylesterase